MSDNIAAFRPVSISAFELEDKFIERLDAVVNEFRQAGMTPYWQQACLSVVMQVSFDEEV